MTATCINSIASVLNKARPKLVSIKFLRNLKMPCLLSKRRLLVGRWTKLLLEQLNSVSCLNATLALDRQMIKIQVGTDVERKTTDVGIFP